MSLAKHLYIVHIEQRASKLMTFLIHNLAQRSFLLICGDIS